jgi:GT2 family glycosyltransferase
VILLVRDHAHLTYACLRSLASATTLPFEVLLVDNGSGDETRRLLSRVDGLRVLTNDENVGFVEGCNQGARDARGKFLVFLNNDTRVLPDTIDRLVETCERGEDVGAVGGRLVHFDGRLQEAGSFLWGDGSGQGYGRHDDPCSPPYMYRRDVDYCSGAFLLTPRQVWDSMGGFDPAFSPAYYEETDYCWRLWEAGLRVVYEPEAAIMHLEYGSSETADDAVALMVRNREAFLERHAGTLDGRSNHDPQEILMARSRRREGPRILQIDDRVPHPELGRGYPRSHALLLALYRIAGELTFFPAVYPMEAWENVYVDIPREVEVITGGGAEKLKEFLTERLGHFDVIFVSRPHNMVHLRQVLLEEPALLEGVRIVYDAEAIFALRDIIKATILPDPEPGIDLEEAVRQELSLADGADAVIAVSEREAAHFREQGVTDVRILSHALTPRPTAPDFSEREGFFFLGHIGPEGSPNTDSLRWFLAEVWPRLREELPNAGLVIAGSSSHPDLDFLEADGVEVAGLVSDPTAMYGAARVFIAPTRFSAGVPLKALEAASRGLPLVITDQLEEQLGWKHERDCLAASSGDPGAFAAACARLHEDQELWQTLRREALSRVEESCREEDMAGVLSEVVLPPGRGAQRLG